MHPGLYVLPVIKPLLKPGLGCKHTNPILTGPLIQVSGYRVGSRDVILGLSWSSWMCKEIVHKAGLGAARHRGHPCV